MPASVELPEVTILAPDEILVLADSIPERQRLVSAQIISNCYSLGEGKNHTLRKSLDLLVAEYLHRLVESCILGR